MRASKVSMHEREFVGGLEKFLCMLRTVAQFHELELRGPSPRSLKLIWHGGLVGTASHDGKVAHFNPRVAREPARTCIEMIFADWAGAALRRARLKRIGRDSRRKISRG
jgi:hypothetical protein